MAYNPQAHYDPQQQQYQQQGQPQQFQPQGQPQQQYQQQGQQQYQQSPVQQQAPPQEQQQQFQQPPADAEPPIAPGSESTRWTWRSYPNTVKTSTDAAGGMLPLPQSIIPLAAMYTPLQVPSSEASLPVVKAAPQLCKNCGAAWNCHSRFDTNGGYWTCRSCLTRNVMTPEVQVDIPAISSSCTVEYASGEHSGAIGPCFVFVVDTCVPADELASLQRNLLRAVEMLPPQTQIAFITFGRGVTVWELGCTDLNKCYALRGTRQYTTDDLTKKLNISASTPVAGRFVMARDECEFSLSSIMEELTVDPFPVPTGQRPERATGTAVDVAVTLMEFLGPKRFGKVVLFTGGACTRGPGTIVTTDKGEMIRFHRDILDGNVPHYNAAHGFYNKIEERLAAANTCLDVFAMSLDQVGVLELRNCVNRSGGVMVCGDTFDHAMFSESLYRYFQRAGLGATGPIPAAGFSAEISVHCSNDTLVAGAVGPCRPSSTPVTRHVSPLAVGSSGTSKWHVSCLDQHVTIAIVFDTQTVEGTTAPSAQSVQGQERFVQFQTRYIAPDGTVRVRVTSIIQPVNAGDSANMLNHGFFDQQCATAVLSRLTVWLLETHETKWESTRRWLDRLLVRFVKQYGQFRVGQPDSLRLIPKLALFPTFLYNLRRSEYFMILNISPDETTFKRHWLMREPCDQVILMIQPTLDSYSLENPAQTPVPLDASAITPNNILLMDAFYNIHVVLGTTIHEWEKMKYHENPEYAHFKYLLEAPMAHAQQLLAERFPYPRFSKTDVDGGEARHLKTRLNPSITHNSGQMQSGQKSSAEVIYTDDASIARFMQTLKQAVVSPDSK